jgi:cholesterol transport system auxiliary component
MYVGVEKVKVPEYLFKREIAIAKSNSEVIFLSDGTWAEDLDVSLTMRLIAFFQKKLQQPEVHAYPWECESQPTQRVKVVVTRFIAQGGYVYLEASWKISHTQSKQELSELFATKVALKNETTSEIVLAMDKAFSQLENVIAKALTAQISVKNP